MTAGCKKPSSQGPGWLYPRLPHTPRFSNQHAYGCTMAGAAEGGQRDGERHERDQPASGRKHRAPRARPAIPPTTLARANRAQGARCMRHRRLGRTERSTAPGAGHAKRQGTTPITRTARATPARPRRASSARKDGRPMLLPRDLPGPAHAAGDERLRSQTAAGSCPSGRGAGRAIAQRFQEPIAMTAAVRPTIPAHRMPRAPARTGPCGTPPSM